MKTSSDLEKPTELTTSVDTTKMGLNEANEETYPNFLLKIFPSEIDEKKFKMPIDTKNGNIDKKIFKTTEKYHWQRFFIIILAILTFLIRIPFEFINNYLKESELGTVYEGNLLMFKS